MRRQRLPRSVLGNKLADRYSRLSAGCNRVDLNSIRGAREMGSAVSQSSSKGQRHSYRWRRANKHQSQACSTVFCAVSRCMLLQECSRAPRSSVPPRHHPIASA